jgi:uncharacterized protein YecE (DUF72 family)
MSGIQWHIGCSGFHYKEWKEVFYPKGLPQRKWFDYYCEHFDTLELNVTFYRFPEMASLQNWYNKSPARFLFSVKAPRLITHYKKFEDCASLLADFYTTIRNGLQEKLGCVLFQLPPSLAYTPALLTKIAGQLDPAFNNVIEFRHSSWWNRDVYETLAARHLTFCGISHPQLPDQPIATTDVVYYRFHGVPRLYYSGYSNEFLDTIARNISGFETVKQAFLYFNNTADVIAIANARHLQSSLLHTGGTNLMGTMYPIH